MACRTAGRLGEGGGPGRRGDIFPPSRSAVLNETQVLQKGEGDAAHQRVSVQPRPGTPLEVTYPEFLLELLVRLLTDPARLDGGRQRTQRRVGGQVAEVILALA